MIVNVRYMRDKQDIGRQMSEMCVCVCAGDVPARPGPPAVEAVGERVLRAWWAEPDARGAPVLAYRVWGRPRHRCSTLFFVLQEI